MVHFQLRHFVAQHPHGGRLRARRDRRLAAIKPAHATKLWYASTLNRHVITRLRTLGVDVLEALRPHWPRVTDAVQPTIRFEVSKAKSKLPELGTFAGHVATTFVRKALGNVDDRLSASIKTSLGVDVRRTLVEAGPILDEMRLVQEENVDLITSIPEQYFDDLTERLEEGWEIGARWEDMVEDVAHIGDVAESRAVLIARDQNAKATGAFNRVRQTSLGVDRYEWQTAGDDRVRESHAELEGQVFSWDDPPTDDEGDTGHPGELGVNCRCVAAPVLDLDEPDEEEFDLDDLDEGEEDQDEEDLG